MRLDLYLVQNQFFESRSKAQTAIKESCISVNGALITKPNYEVELEDVVDIIKTTLPYVSRGGLKLEGAIKAFLLDFKDKIVLDIGASTGGFTDCALQHGAKLVYAVDVGTNQLALSLRNKKEVKLLEQTNILDITGFPTTIDYILMDVSFVSIEKMLPAIDRFLTEDNAFVCLIKPQFEAGKKYFKNGVIRDKAIHLQVLRKVEEALASYHMGIRKLIPSPILGGSGNKEFIALIQRNVVSNINLLEVCR